METHPHLGHRERGERPQPLLPTFRRVPLHAVLKLRWLVTAKVELCLSGFWKGQSKGLSGLRVFVVVIPSRLGRFVCVPALLAVFPGHIPDLGLARR